MSISTERFVRLHIELFKISERMLTVAREMERDGVPWYNEIYEIIDDLSVAAANSLDMDKRS